MTPLPTTAVSGTTISRRRPAWFALWPLLPIVIYLAVLFIYPVAQLLWLSVVDNQGELTRLHYARLFASAVYVKVLGITFRIALWTTVFAVIASYPVAYLLATATERTRNNLILWVLMPFWTSFLVRTFAWIVLLGRKGAINDWLQQLGIVDAPAPLIYNFAGVMIGMVHALMPLAVVTMLAVMRNIDENLPKAASTLGARGGQSFWRVYFPLSLPGVASGALLVFIVSLGFFITPALLGSVGDAHWGTGRLCADASAGAGQRHHLCRHPRAHDHPAHHHCNRVVLPLRTARPHRHHERPRARPHGGLCALRGGRHHGRAQKLRRAARPGSMESGGEKLQTLRHITFPLILPGLIAAYLFAFVISLDELTIALFVSGGQAPTLPKQMWVDAIFKVNPMVTAVSTVVLVFVTSLILVAEVARRRSEQASGT